MKRSSPRKAPLLTLRHTLAAQAQHSGIYLRTLAKWLFCALLTGGVCGLLGTLGGAAVWQTLENGLNMIGAQVGIQRIVIGAQVIKEYKID